jgi:hypothetical protein
MSKEKDPALKVTMRSVVATEKDTEPEEKETVDTDEESTTDGPQSGEEDAESAESDEDDAEGAETEGESSEDDEPVERLEFYTEGEEGTPQPEVKDKRGFAKLRKTVREQAMKIAEMERKLQAQSAPVGAPDPGPEPTEEDDDVQYDMAKLKTKYAKWLKDGEAKKAWEAEQAKVVETHRQATQQIMDSYKATKADFSKKVDGYEEAEQAFTRMFDDARQDVLFRNCSNPAKVIFLLHQRPELMEKLSKSTNRDEIVRELVKLEVTVKERKVGTPPPPPKKVGGNATKDQGNDPVLERLRKEAAKTGNMKPVTDYLREQQNKARSQKERGK